MNSVDDRRTGDGYFIHTTDSLGESVVLLVDLDVFEKAAIFKAAYWATGKTFFYFLPIETSKPNLIQIEIRPKDGKESAEYLAREFANSLIDYQTRQIVLRETAKARDALLNKAFGEGQKHLNPDALN